jgi:hypothetical protein
MSFLAPLSLLLLICKMGCKIRARQALLWLSQCAGSHWEEEELLPDKRPPGLLPESPFHPHLSFQCPGKLLIEKPNWTGLIVHLWPMITRYSFCLLSSFYEYSTIQTAHLDLKEPGWFRMVLVVVNPVVGWVSPANRPGHMKQQVWEQPCSSVGQSHQSATEQVVRRILLLVICVNTTLTAAVQLGSPTQQLAASVWGR